MSIGTEAAHAVADRYELDSDEWTMQYRMALYWVEEFARVGYGLVRLDPDAAPHELAQETEAPTSA